MIVSCKLIMARKEGLEMCIRPHQIDFMFLGSADCSFETFAKKLVKNHKLVTAMHAIYSIVNLAQLVSDYRTVESNCYW